MRRPSPWDGQHENRDALIIALRAQGWSYDQIAKIADVGKVRCRQIVKKFMDSGQRVKRPDDKIVN